MERSVNDKDARIADSERALADKGADLTEVAAKLETTRIELKANFEQHPPKGVCREKASRNALDRKTKGNHPSRRSNQLRPMLMIVTVVIGGSLRHVYGR